MKVHCVLLAAGQSTRFDDSKLLAPIAGQPLIRRILEIVSRSVAAGTHVVVGHDEEKIRSSISGIPHEVVTNARYRGGMGTSISAGVRALPDDCDAVVIVLGDQPLITADHIDLLIRESNSHPGRIVTTRYLEATGPPVVFPRSAFSDLAALRGDTGARKLLNGSALEVIEVDVHQAFVDIDTPEDLHRARKALQEIT